MDNGQYNRSVVDADRTIQYMLILSHPDQNSLNHGIAQRITTICGEEGRHLWVHDLYQEHFSPVLENDELRRRFSFDDTYTTHVRHIRDSQGIIIIYPDWWGMPPAILKGWLDRMFRPGLAYDFVGNEFERKQKVSLLQGKKALIITTTNETNPLSQEPMCRIWRESVMEYVGIDDVTFRILYGVRDASRRQRRLWMEDLATLVRQWV